MEDTAVCSHPLCFTVYAKTSKYAHCDPSFLEWRYRSNKIRQCLAETDGNIFCLQELQADVFGNFCEQLQESDDYNCILQNTTNNVGCAVLLRPSRQFTVLATESRSRALIVTMRDNISRTPMIVASVHLEAGRDNEETRFYQVRSLLKRIESHRRKFIPDLAPTVIIAGDWNKLHGGPVFDWLSTGKWNTTDQKNVKKSKVPQYPFLPAISFEHKEIQRTFSKQSILDYIWVSQSASETFHVKSCLAFASRKTVDGGEWWPSQDHPSDHWPIGIELLQRNASSGMK